MLSKFPWPEGGHCSCFQNVRCTQCSPVGGSMGGVSGCHGVKTNFLIVGFRMSSGSTSRSSDICWINDGRPEKGTKGMSSLVSQTVAVVWDSVPDVPRARPIACDGSSRLPHMLSLLVAQMKRRGRDWKNPDGVASLRIPVVVPTICLVPYSNPVQRERRWWRATTRRGAAPSAVPCRRVVVIPLVSGCVPML